MIFGKDDCPHTQKAISDFKTKHRSFIYINVDKLLSDKEALQKQIIKSQEIIRNFKTDKSTEIASAVLLNHL